MPYDRLNVRNARTSIRLGVAVKGFSMLTSAAIRFAATVAFKCLCNDCVQVQTILPPIPRIIHLKIVDARLICVIDGSGHCN